MPEVNLFYSSCREGCSEVFAYMFGVLRVFDAMVEIRERAIVNLPCRFLLMIDAFGILDSGFFPLLYQCHEGFIGGLF